MPILGFLRSRQDIEPPIKTPAASTNRDFFTIGFIQAAARDIAGRQRSSHLGLRLSKKACTPSWASWVVQRRAKASFMSSNCLR